MKSRFARISLVDLTAFVIVVSVLTGAAAPRFGAVEAVTPADSVEALAGSMRSVSALVHAVWQADGGRAASVDLDGTAVVVDAQGFPLRTSIRDALPPGLVGADRGFVELAPGGGVFAPAEAVRPEDCNVSFQDATASTPPRVVTRTTGCG